MAMTREEAISYILDTLARHTKYQLDDGFITKGTADHYELWDRTALKALGVTDEEIDRAQNS